MKIPFDAAEFAQRLDNAAENLSNLMLGLSVKGREHIRLDDKSWVVEVCIIRFRDGGVDEVVSTLDRMAQQKNVTGGTREGINLVRGYLNEYEWSV